MMSYLDCSSSLTANLKRLNYSNVSFSATFIAVWLPTINHNSRPNQQLAIECAPIANQQVASIIRRTTEWIRYSSAQSTLIDVSDWGAQVSAEPLAALICLEELQREKAIKQSL